MSGRPEGPYEAFCDELDTLIRRWTEKPADDRLSYGQMVGALETMKHRLLTDALAEPTDADPG